MKKVIQTIIASLILSAAIASADMARFLEVAEDAGKYALNQMRPTATFKSSSIARDHNGKARIRVCEAKEGGQVKVRIITYWVTAFTGKDRTTVIDVFLTEKEDGVYITRYTLKEDNHNIGIGNPKDAKVLKRLVKYVEDDF